MVGFIVTLELVRLCFTSIALLRRLGVLAPPSDKQLLNCRLQDKKLALQRFARIYRSFPKIRLANRFKVHVVPIVFYLRLDYVLDPFSDEAGPYLRESINSIKQSISATENEERRCSTAGS